MLGAQLSLTHYIRFSPFYKIVSMKSSQKRSGKINWKTMIYISLSILSAIFLYDHRMSPCGEHMKYTIVYWSRYGNGKKLVEHLSGKLKEKKAETQILTTDDANPSAMPPADVYIFSAPAEALGIQKNMKTFMKKLQGMEEKKYGIINTYGMKKNRLDKMEKLLSKKKMVKLAGIGFHVEGEVQSGNGLTQGWEQQLDEFAGKL
jgi:flavodoxin